MIGPVQLMVIGYNDPGLPAPLRAKIEQLRADPAVRIIDVLGVRKKPDGTVETEPVEQLIPEYAHEPGTIIERLLIRAGAARTMGERPWEGPGYLFRGDLPPDFRTTMTSGSGAIALLLEHRWAIPLRDGASEANAYPVAEAWIGHEALKDVELVPQNA